MTRERSSRVLDQNLAQLLTRAYAPVRPRPEFVRELEGALQPWLAPERAAQSAPRRAPLRLVGALVAAAALVLLLFTLGGRDGGTPAMRTPGALAAAGEVAVRATGPDGAPGPWRAATPSERLGLMLPEGGGVEVVTPASAAQRVVGEGWAVELEPGGALVAIALEDRIGFRCTAGRARARADGDEALALEASDAPSPHLEYLIAEARFARPADDGVAALSSTDAGRREALDPEDAPTPAEEEREEPPAAGLAVLEVVLTPPEGGPPIDGGEAFLLRRLELPQVAFPTRLEFTGAAFTWEGVEPGEYSLFVDLPGYAMWKGGRLTFEEERTSRVEATPEVGARVRGFVIDPATGDALQGALVVSESAMPLQAVGIDPEQFGGVRGGWTLTGPDGSFELEELARGQHLLRASSAGFAPTWLELDVASDPTDGVMLELREGGTVEGRCEHPDGRPFARAQIVVSRFSAGRTDDTMTFEISWTDAEGRYRIEHLAPGFYVVLYFTENAAQGEFQPKYRPVAVREGETHRIDFLGEERGGSIFGVVRDGEGEPVAFANLHVWSPVLGEASWIGDTADAEGRFEVNGLEPGDYQLYAGVANNTVHVADVTLEQGGRVEQDATLQGRTLTVAVEDGISGDPLNYIDLSLVDAGSPSVDLRGYSRMSARVFSSTEGRVVLRHLEDGEYDLYVMPETSEYAMQIVAGVRVSAETEAEVQRIRLLPAGGLALVVTDADGAPVAGAEVELTGPTGDRWLPPWTPKTDVEGRAALERLQEGLWGLRVTAPGHAAVELDAAVVAGSAPRLEVVLERE